MLLLYLQGLDDMYCACRVHELLICLQRCPVVSAGQLAADLCAAMVYGVLSPFSDSSESALPGPR